MVLIVGALVAGLALAVATIVYAAGPSRSPATEELLRDRPII